MKPITYQKRARKALQKMPRKDAQRVTAKIKEYATDPRSQASNVKALKDRDGIRLRVGNWRVIMEDGDVLDILDVGPRGSIYGP